MRVIIISGNSGLTATSLEVLMAANEVCMIVKSDEIRDNRLQSDELEKMFIIKNYDDYEACKILIPKSDYEWWNPPVIGRPVKPVLLPKITIRNSLPRKIRVD